VSLNLDGCGDVGKVCTETSRQLWQGGMDEPKIYLFWLMGFVAMSKGLKRPPEKVLNDLALMWDRLRFQGADDYYVAPIDGIDVDVMREANRELERWKKLAKGHPGGSVPIGVIKPVKA